MSIKTKYNPLGGRSNDRFPELEMWRYANIGTPKKTVLYGYLGNNWSEVINVPYCKGKTVINQANPFNNSNTPFKNNTNVQYVDLCNVPFTNNNMYLAFSGCSNLIGVYNIPNNTIDMSETFNKCTNFNQNIRIPDSVTDMSNAFHYCNNFNQSMTIPNNVTNMANAFFYCSNLKANIQIFSPVVTDATNCFRQGGAKNVQIPHYYLSSTGAIIAKTQTFNSFVAAGYVDDNGNSLNQHSVTITLTNIYI